MTVFSSVTLACSKAFMPGCFIDVEYAWVDSKVWLPFINLFRPSTKFLRLKLFKSTKKFCL